MRVMKVLLISLAFGFKVFMMLANDTSGAAAGLAHPAVVDRKAVLDVVGVAVRYDLHLGLCWYERVVL